MTVGFVDADVNDLESLGARLAAQEAKRHQRITEVIESTELRTFFSVEDDSDFSGTPRAVDVSERGMPWTAA